MEDFVGVNLHACKSLLMETTRTHTHNRFTALLEFVRDYPGEQVPKRYNQEG